MYNEDEYTTERFYLDSIRISLNYALLPLELFPNGYLYFELKENSETDKEATERRKNEFQDVYVIHNNWIIGKDKKQKKFQEKKGELWLLDDNESCVTF